MRITLFSSNNPRHLALAERLAEVAETVFMVQECVTVFPGVVGDFYKRTDIMQNYFSRVIAAEGEVFGRPRFLPPNVRQLALRTGDVSLAELDIFGDALEADIFIVFGASWIRPPLVDVLVSKRAINIHMGMSPYYRGSSTNFWAMYDRRPEMVGATVHLLSRGLDSGGILYHVRPRPEAVDPFVFGMLAVDAAQKSLVNRVASGEISNMVPLVQDRSLELRYTKNEHFTDVVAGEYLARLPAPSELLGALKSAEQVELLNLFVP